jgi:hypothetical protein
MPRVHYAHIDDQGRIHMDSPEVFKQAARVLAGKPAQLTLGPISKRRSDRQNAWYWGRVLEIIAKDTGNEADDLHEYFKSRFIPKRLAICDGNGVVIDDRVIGGSTTRLSTVDMAAYCDAIRQFAAEELGLVIPDPDPSWARGRG